MLYYIYSKGKDNKNYGMCDVLAWNYYGYSLLKSNMAGAISDKRHSAKKDNKKTLTKE